MPDRREPLTKDERDLHRDVQLKNLDGHLGIEAEHHAALILRLLDQVEALEEDKDRLDFVIDEMNIMPDAYDPTVVLFDRKYIDCEMNK